MKNKNWIFVVIIVAIIVGVVAVLITANLTGDAIWNRFIKASSTTGTKPVNGGTTSVTYATYQGVLDMLNSCRFIPSDTGQNCNDACRYGSSSSGSVPWGQTCIFETPIGIPTIQGYPYACSSGFAGQATCVCCNP